MRTRIADLGDFQQGHTPRTPTGVEWLNKHTDGGLSLLSKIWICGEPGTGKTVLAMQIVAGSQFRRVLWYSRHPASHSRMLLEHFSSPPSGEARVMIEEQTGLAALSAAIERFDPDLVVVDELDRLDLDVEGVGGFITDHDGSHASFCNSFASKALYATRGLSVPVILTGKSKSVKVQFDMDLVIELHAAGRASITKNRLGTLADGLQFRLG